MASSPDPPPDKPEVARTIGCCIAILGAIVLILGLGWLALYLIFAPSSWKTVIGKVKIADHGTMYIGRAHDGDISYNYYVRVRGAGGKVENWTYVDWSLDPTEKSETAQTSDSRYAAISFQCEYGKRIVIYDSVDKELWWNADEQWQSTTKFVRAWNLLHSKNPRLPAPPF